MIQNSQSIRSPYAASAAGRRSSRTRLLALLVTLAVGLSVGLLYEFHNQTRISERLGEAASPVPITGPLAYFPR